MILDVLVYIIVILYILAALFVLLHSLFDLHLILHYLLSHTKKKVVESRSNYSPFVTIQLPVYNELHVVERLLDAAAGIDYPADKIEIQVLDDSTDETSELIARKILSLHLQPISILHIRRQNREGFKAGALKHGLNSARGEFLAIFDADFLPSKDFLKRTIPFFLDEAIGMVQTNWGHINKKACLLTKLQALALDGHFSIEQQGRNAAGYFINFNGTAGVWRKHTILDAGNWQADTLTEDFDLSYRAQMKGWKFKYLEDCVTPAELPALITSLKSQQFRWTKGGAETARKNLKKLIYSPLPFSVKLHGVFHLIYSFGFISIIIYTVLSVPLIFVKEFYPQFSEVFAFAGIVGYSLFIYILHYFISWFNTTTGSIAKRVFGFMIHFPLFVSLFIGISLSNAIGIMQGYLGIKSGFVRTPKFNSINPANRLKSRYAEANINWLTLLEGILIFYFLFGSIQAFYFKNYITIPLLLIAFTGFSMVFWLSIIERKMQVK